MEEWNELLPFLCDDAFIAFGFRGLVVMFILVGADFFVGCKVWGLY